MTKQDTSSLSENTSRRTLPGKSISKSELVIKLVFLFFYSTGKHKTFGLLKIANYCLAIFLELILGLHLGQSFKSYGFPGACDLAKIHAGQLQS